MYGNADIKFANDESVKRVQDVIYLGVNINQQMNIQKEINMRIQTAMATWKRLDEFWRGSNCTVRQKLIVFEAVIRRKVLYGTESAQLNYPTLSRLNTFQLKGIRKILGWKTTYIDRSLTNDKLLAEAQSRLRGNKN